MKWYRKFVKWLRHQYRQLSTPKYKAIAVTGYPAAVQAGTVYIVSEGTGPDTLIFKCPCGCHADIYLNLLKDTRPQWVYDVKPKGRITITPSVWRKVGCKSHFCLRDGRIIWV